MDRVSLEFRAHIIASRLTSLSVSGTRYKRLYDIALLQLQEAVDLAIEDIAKVMK